MTIGMCPSDGDECRTRSDCSGICMQFRYVYIRITHHGSDGHLIQYFTQGHHLNSIFTDWFLFNLVPAKGYCAAIFPLPSAITFTCIDSSRYKASLSPIPIRSGMIPGVTGLDFTTA